MAKAVKLSEDIVLQAQIMGTALNRSIAGQIEYWAKIGKLVEENPDLNYEFYEGKLELILLALETHKNFYRDIKRNI